MITRIVAISLLFAQSLVWAQSENSELPWKLAKSENGIRIHTREHQGGLVEIRAQMFTPTTYQAFLVLLEDSDNLPNWLDKVSSSKVLKQLSTNENIVYTQFSAPWPARDRDMVTYSKYEIDNGTFKLEIKDAADQYPEQTGYVRIKAVQADWTLEKLTNGLTHIDYTAYADPGGYLPDWLTNQLSVSSAFNTFEALKTQLPNYQNSHHPNLNE
ncbi:START domain-containing protein [Vibrio ziniensis]|uniref:START domain-containing protein n=1 Tax=Vibrio ziniensis TaxID=2711221 RepID=A0A6G7CNH1_9VIBR|nr:START domain-containing protein [Vibrio ziniensis]QIH43652.1 START domain-containing protein [Vibrio ziniensis]